MVLILFDPARTAATHPPVYARLVDPDDADELAQVLYPLPDDKHAINRILSTMGSAKGVMAFAQSVAHSSTKDGAFHIVTTTKKRTVLFRPRDETYLLAVFPADKDTPDAVLKDTVRAAWDTATLLFGLEPWLGDASEWWARWEAHILDNGPSRRGLPAWISGGEVSDAMTLEYAETPDEVVGHFTALRECVSSSADCDATTCYAVNLTANSTNTLTNTTIYQNPPTPIYPTLTHHLIDLIHSFQPPTPSLPAARDRTRSPASHPRPDKPAHQASKWTTLSLSTGGIPFLPSASRQSSQPAPAKTASKANGKGIASWLGFGSSVISLAEEPPTDVASKDNTVPEITTLDEPALDEALVTQQPIDIRWHAQCVFLPTVPPDAKLDEETMPERPLRKYALAYTIHTRTLVAVILNPSDQSPEDLAARLNAPTHSRADVQSVLSELVRALQMPVEPASATPKTSSLPDTTATQYIHHTHSPHDRLVSHWSGHDIVSSAPKKVHPSTPGKMRPRRDITIDHLGTSARQSLISVDDAREVFARTANNVWVVGKRVPEETMDHMNMGWAGEEAYMVISASETSILDAECKYSLGRRDDRTDVAMT